VAITPPAPAPLGDGSQEDDGFFVEFWDSLIAQIRVDAKKLASAIRRGDYPSRLDARTAVIQTTLPENVKLRAEFVGPKARNASFREDTLSAYAMTIAARDPERSRTQAARLAAAIAPELSDLFAALRERYPEDSGVDAADARGAKRSGAIDKK
jgi:hypothetical protein